MVHDKIKMQKCMGVGGVSALMHLDEGEEG